MRKDAIFYDVFAGHREHQVLGSLPRMGSIYRRVKQASAGPRRRSTFPPTSACTATFRSRSGTTPRPRKAAFAALLTEPENLKIIVLVDEDIDVFNEPEVMWAIGTRFRADKGLHVIPDLVRAWRPQSFRVGLLPRRHQGGAHDAGRGDRRDQAEPAGRVSRRAPWCRTMRWARSTSNRLSSHSPRRQAIPVTTPASLVSEVTCTILPYGRPLLIPSPSHAREQGAKDWLNRTLREVCRGTAVDSVRSDSPPG